MNIEKFKNIESRNISVSGNPALSILHGSNSYKITLNKLLVEKLQLATKAKADDKGEIYIDIQSLIHENQLAIGKFIRKDANVFRAKLSDGVASFYSTPLAHAVEAGMNYQIPKNKTVRFEQIDVEADDKGNLIAVVTCTH